jgi:hypothetical protein
MARRATETGKVALRAFAASNAHNVPNRCASIDRILTNVWLATRASS